MYEFIFKNAMDDEIYIAKNTPFTLEMVSGISNVGSVNQNESSPFQDGSTYIDTLLTSRFISFIVQIRSDLETNRRKAIQILNPKLGEGTLTFTKNGVSRNLTCVVSEMVDLLESHQNRRPTMQRFTFSIEANQPYWEGAMEEWILAGFTGGFEFPFSFPFSLGEVGTSITLNNDGDAIAPLFIELNGPLTNPTLTNETTGDYLSLTQALLTNEVLEINTAFGKKTVVLIDADGVRSNGFGYLDPESELFGLAIGDNTLSYVAEVQPDDTAVTLWFKKRYIGV